MQAAGICGRILFLDYVFYLSFKRTCGTKTAYNRYLSTQSITERIQSSYSLFEKLYSEPMAAGYGASGLPIRRVDGIINAIIHWPSTTAC